MEHLSLMCCCGSSSCSAAIHYRSSKTIEYKHNKHEWQKRGRNFVFSFFLFFSHHIIVKSSKCQPRCNITIYWKGIDLLGYGGDDILSLAQKTKTFTSNQIYLCLVYINELHLNIKRNTISVSQ